MYPIFRLALTMRKAKALGPLAIGETHVSYHRCHPLDIDVMLELNNGRTLTLYDLGRFGMLQRLGVLSVVRAKGWAGTVAGSSVRYRRRVRMFDRIEMRSRIIGWDDRFTYAEQSMWRKGECTSHMLIRIAISGPDGLVPSVEIAAAIGSSPVSPPLPDWVTAWIDAEAQRPWPPV